MDAKASTFGRRPPDRAPWSLTALDSPAGLLFQTWILIAATVVVIYWAAPSFSRSGDQKLSLIGTPVRSMDLLQEGPMTYALVLGHLPGDDREHLAYLESNDRGQTFGAHAIIDLQGETVTSNRANAVRLLAHGRQRIAVYQVKGKFPGNGPIRVAVSKDNGLHWISGIQPVTGDTLDNQGYPSVMLDQQGNAQLFWLDDREEMGETVGLRMATSNDGGLTWQRERTLDDRVCTCCSLHVTELSDSHLAVLYRDHSPKDMRLGLFDSAGSKWTQMPRVGAYDWRFEGCPHMGGGLEGHWLKDAFMLHAAVWTGANTRQGIHYLRSKDFGSSWSDDLLIDEMGSDPDLVTADGERLAIAYRQGIGSDGRILVRTSGDAGLHWDSARSYGSPGVRVEHPKLIADATGFTVFWTETSESNTRRLRLHSVSWNDPQ